jgi:hypothetical protein
MATKKRRKSRAAKCAGTVFLAASVGAASCFGHDDQKHIELRQYYPEPTLTVEVWISTATRQTTNSVFPPFLQNQFE